MSMMNCNCRCTCTGVGVIASAVVGVLTAFLQITGVITVATAFLWVALGIAVAYLAVLVVAGALDRSGERSVCRCTSLNALLAGVLGTVLLSLILLSVGIVETSVASAILVGLLLFFLSLLLTGAACYVRVLAACEE